MTLNSFYILCCHDKSHFFGKNATIRVRKDGGNFDYSMPLLRMSLSGMEGGVEANVANVTKFTCFWSLPLMRWKGWVQSHP